METIKESVAEKYVHDKPNQKKTGSLLLNQGNDSAKVHGGAAIKLMQQIAEGIYDSTPGIQMELPRHTSKILQDVKVAKKTGLINVPNFKNGEIDQMNEMRYEDWQTKYRMILREFEAEK